ncbi:MAG: hypothetical protein LBD02_08120 [Christensenellaceae bacterium]|jgi:hypothetical protein|nr:hypothetical protein [Christensenellaceae bacterium]
MAELTQMVRTLCLLTPALFLLEMLIPAGGMRKSARLVFALIEMLVLLRPIAALVALIKGVV